MANDLIRYDLLVQEALKGVVRRVLSDAAKDGLLGEHHFYISFRTDYPGVRLSQRLRDKYPQEMTIVLQHQFWDLSLTEHTFEVGLSFSGIPERLLIPYDALTGFFDPSVSFGLKFEIPGEDGEGEIAEAPPSAPQRPVRGAGSEPVELQPKKAPAPVPARSASPKVPAKASEAEKGAPRAEKPAKADPAETQKDKDDAGGSAEVVSLDAFRKKN